MSGIEHLLRPRSIAVIGGGFWGKNVIEQCRKIGFSGKIWPVHPKRDTLAGLQTFSEITQLPSAPDAVFIGVKRDLTIEAMGTLAQMGAGGAVCFASGFREAQTEMEDGAGKQEELLAAAGDMTFLGPNCYGFINYLDGVALWPDQHGGIRVDRGVAIIMQSSNIAINLTMQNRGLPIAYMVTTGNQAQTGFSEVARTLLQDERVTTLGLYIEGIDDLRGFEKMVQEAHSLKKPIVVLKIGKSQHAQAATISHTASLTGSDVGAQALFNRLGVGQVNSLPVFLEALKLLHIAGPLGSYNIASMSCSGGEASLIADAAHGTKVSFPPLDNSQEQGLREMLGPKVVLANPLDYHIYIWGDEEALTKAFTAMMQGDLALGLVVLDFPRADRCDPSAWEPVVAAVVRAKQTTGRVMAILSSLNETMPEDISVYLSEKGIVPMMGMVEAIEAIKIAADIGIRSQFVPATPLLLPPHAVEGRVLREAVAKSALVDYGLRIPAASCANSPDAAAQAASRTGFPVVLKGEGIAHKTEERAVVLNLTSPDQVAKAAQSMPCQSFLIEEMITGNVAELLIGVVVDPAHGYVLTLAAGGILTELLEDSTSLLIPVDRQNVYDALSSLRMFHLLSGYRGQLAADIDAILEGVMAVQSYVMATLPQEVEINPLICTPDGAIAADVLIRTGE